MGRTMTTKNIPFSILDLAPVPQGAVPSQAFASSLDLARHAEAWGYHRYWLAEHHNMTGIASAATAVLIGYLAGGTQTLRLGSGGVMLPNHAPLVIAEQFGTLASLYPGRIDLGLGRAPGTDQRTMLALRRHLSSDVDNFPRDVQELLMYFDDVQPGQPVQAVPGQGLHVPLWLLGSSLYSAQLAALLGLPFAFASHFAPELLWQALKVYREEFTPSTSLTQPYAMICINVVAADSERDARFLFTSMQQQFINLRRGRPGPLPAPVEDIESLWSAGEQYGVEQALRMSVVGDRDQVRTGLQKVISDTGIDELMINGQIFDHQARLHSFELAISVREDLIF
jgi:luciferase family oxidoreductase group 1